MGSQEAQGSEETLVLRDHLGFQGMTGNQESLDDQDQKARRVQMGSVALRGLRGLGGTKEKLDQKDFRQTLRHLESLERKVQQGSEASLAIKETRASPGHEAKMDPRVELGTVGLKDFLVTLVEMEAKVLLGAVDPVVTKEE